MRVRNLSQKKIYFDVYLIALVSGLLGARLLHVFYEEPLYYLSNPSKIFFFWEGGFVFYGGFISAFVAGWVYLRGSNLSNHFRPLLNIAAPVLSLGICLGRWSCFWAGCCFGKACPYFWSIKGLHPTQIYSSLWELMTLLVLLFVERQKRWSKFLFEFWAIIHGIGRLWIEQFRGDFRGPVYIFSISTWMSLLLIALAIASVLWSCFFKPRQN